MDERAIRAVNNDKQEIEDAVWNQQVVYLGKIAV
jgi:hypothetical protein